MKARIIRDAPDGFTLDNHGAPIYAYLPPPAMRSHGRIRRAALIVGALVAALLLAVLIVLDAQAASDAPVRGQRYRVCKLVSIDPPTYKCVWKVAR